MLRRLLPMVLVVAFVPVTARAQDAVSKPLQGRWVVTGGEHGGKPMDAIKGGVMTIAGDAFEIRTASGNMLKGTLKLDQPRSAVADGHDPRRRRALGSDLRDRGRDVPVELRREGRKGHAADDVHDVGRNGGVIVRSVARAEVSPACVCSRDLFGLVLLASTTLPLAGQPATIHMESAATRRGAARAR